MKGSQNFTTSLEAGQIFGEEHHAAVLCMQMLHLLRDTSTVLVNNAEPAGGLRSITSAQW